MNMTKQEKARHKRARKADRGEGFSPHARKQLDAPPTPPVVRCQSCKKPYYVTEDALVEVPVDNGTVKLCPGCRGLWDRQEGVTK